MLRLPCYRRTRCTVHCSPRHCRFPEGALAGIVLSACDYTSDQICYRSAFTTAIPVNCRFPGGAAAAGELERPLSVRVEHGADDVEPDPGRRRAPSALRQTRQLVLQRRVSGEGDQRDVD